MINPDSSRSVRPAAAATAAAAAGPRGQVGRKPAQAPLSLRQRVWHTLLVLAGWVLFAWSWQRVTADRPELGELRWLMMGALIVVPLLTLAWVAHNVGIHRRKGPRRSVPVVEVRYEADFNGRSIEADWTALAQARRVDIVVDGSRKRFVDADRLPQPAVRLTESVS
ncbi:MAG: hypothetical protein IT501_05800 [Rubrivivax sp.]|nr:hypothetical protein [Rubrivivax sp.]